MKRFVPVADEVWRLHHEKGRDCDLFRKIAEQGHYAGRVFPSDTRQGIYACAPSGGSDFVSRQPKDSVVLKVFCRDLDREQIGDDWRTTAYNVDFAWLRGKEVDSFVPKAELGAACEVSDAIVRRFAALHFVDTVRGQSPAYEDKEVESASLHCKAVEVGGDRLKIEFSGGTKTRAHGRWSVSNFRDAGKPTDQERGVDLTLGGHAIWDTAAKKFVEFHLVGTGTRFGGTQFNERGRDLAPTAIGFAVVLAGDHERVTPATPWRYPGP